MNILLVSYLFPPEVNPQSVLSARFAKYLQRAGHQVTVLAGSNVEKFNSSHGSDNLLLDELLGVNTIFIPDRKSAGVLNGLKNRIIYHENYSYWVSAVLRTVLDLPDKNKFDIIYTLAAPLASNIAGLTIKCATGIPWVAHFSDPTLTVFNRRFKSPIRNYLAYRDEKLIFKHADAITFVNIETLEQSTGFNPEYRGKCHVIPHCYDPDYFGAQTVQTKQTKTVFTYVGSLYSRRNPYDFIKALNIAINKYKISKDSIEVNFYGSIEPGLLPDPGNDQYPWIKIHGTVSYRDSIKAMLRCDYLVLIDMPDEVNLYTPSKLIDYLAALKPIIAITSSLSNTAKILNCIGYPVVEPNNPELLAKILSKLFSRNRSAISQAHLQLMNDYRPDVVVDKLIHVFHQLNNDARGI